MMRSTPRARASRGFTLIEVLLASALFTALMVLLYAGMTSAVRAYEAAESRTESVVQMRAVSAFLRRSLSGASAMAAADARDWTLLFDGGDGRVRYVADLPGYVGIAGLHEIIVEDVLAETGRMLLMHRRPLDIAPDGRLQGAFDSRTLLPVFDGMDVRFFGSDDAREPPSWRERWPQGKQMPLLVELRIRGADGDPWPPLIVRPQADAMRYMGVAATVPGAARPARSTDGGAPASGSSRAISPPGGAPSALPSPGSTSPADPTPTTPAPMLVPAR